MYIVVFGHILNQKVNDLIHKMKIVRKIQFTDLLFLKNGKKNEDCLGSKSNNIKYIKKEKECKFCFELHVLLLVFDYLFESTHVGWNFKISSWKTHHQ